MAITVPRRQLFIGGQWTEPVLRKTLPVVNPATEDIIGTFYFFQSYLVLLTFWTWSLDFREFRFNLSLSELRISRFAVYLVRELKELWTFVCLRRSSFLLWLLSMNGSGSCFCVRSVGLYRRRIDRYVVEWLDWISSPADGVLCSVF